MTDAEAEYNRDAYGTPLGKPYRGLGVLTVKENPDEYNGWTNRETWAVNLWLSNVQYVDQEIRERVAEAVAESREYWSASDMPNWTPAAGNRRAGVAIKEYVDEMIDPENGTPATEIIGMLKDIGSLYRVNWEEVAKAFAEE